LGEPRRHLLARSAPAAGPERGLGPAAHPADGRRSVAPGRYGPYIGTATNANVPRGTDPLT
jgi:topoisomerase IA-like protein